MHRAEFSSGPNVYAPWVHPPARSKRKFRLTPQKPVRFVRLNYLVFQTLLDQCFQRFDVVSERCQQVVRT